MTYRCDAAMRKETKLSGTSTDPTIRAALTRHLIVEEIARKTTHLCPDGQQLRRVIGEMLDAGEITPEQYGIRRVGASRIF